MQNYSLAIVPGDGIGHEIVPAALKTLDKVATISGFEINYTFFEWGAGYYKKYGHFMPENGLETLNKFDAILFGAVGLPDVDDTLPAKDYTFKVRTGFEQYVNFRPIRTFPGVTRPLRTREEIDFVVVRENTEGEFVQVGNQVQPEKPGGMGIDTSIFTRKGTERIARYAFKLAQQRKKKVTAITKSNTLINSLTFWDRVIAEVSREFPDIEFETMYIDNCSANFVLRPERFDVVLTTNLFGDILSDLGGAIMGSLGLAGSGNINPEKDYPSMFEPIHGSAPDIAGTGIANPVGTIWSVALLLRHIGQNKAADLLMNAVDNTLRSGIQTVDIGGKASTMEFADAVVKNLG